MLLSEHSLESMEAASNGPRVLRVESQVFCPRDDRSFPLPPNLPRPDVLASLPALVLLRLLVVALEICHAIVIYVTNVKKLKIIIFIKYYYPFEIKIITLLRVNVK